MENINIFNEFQKNSEEKLVVGIYGQEKELNQEFIQLMEHQLFLPQTKIQILDASETNESIEHVSFGMILISLSVDENDVWNDIAEPEKNWIDQFKKRNKQFLCIINTNDNNSLKAREVQNILQKNYDVPGIIFNIKNQDSVKLQQILDRFSSCFSIKKIVFHIPKWTETLESGHWLKKELFLTAKEFMQQFFKENSQNELLEVPENPNIKEIKIVHVNVLKQTAEVDINVHDSLYYNILSEMTGTKIESEYQLISIVREMAGMKQKYEMVVDALDEVNQTGYGIIRPSRGEMILEDPVIIKQGNRYGVRIKAVSPSIHMIRAEVETEISPIVGNETQAQDLIHYMTRDNNDHEGPGNALIFGKSVEQMIEEGIQTKLSSVNEGTQQKLQNAMKRIVNESKHRLICFII